MYLIFHDITQRAVEIDCLIEAKKLKLHWVCYRAEFLAKRFVLFLRAFIDRHNQSEFADPWKSDHIASRKSPSHTLQVLPM